MNILNWFRYKPPTDKELQDELHALVDKIIAKQYSSFQEEDRYERLLIEIYKRNLTPCILLKPTPNH